MQLTHEFPMIVSFSTFVHVRSKSAAATSPLHISSLSNSLIASATKPRTRAPPPFPPSNPRTSSLSSLKPAHRLSHHLSTPSPELATVVFNPGKPESGNFLSPRPSNFSSYLALSPSRFDCFLSFVIVENVEKYDAEKLNDSSNDSDVDAFARLYRDVENDIEAAFQKVEVTKVEKNRVAAVLLNAEIRRTKARLMEEVPKLQRLAQKRVIR
ncbi:hypothetical protein Droror1_Dr00012564 [Drosera rotundifolia]